MGMKYVMAIVRPDVVAELRTRLPSLHVRGMTMMRVQGFGEYIDFFSENHFTDHVKIEIFVEDAKVEALANTIMEVAHSDIPGAGILAVLPADQFYHIRTRAASLPDEP